VATSIVAGGVALALRADVSVEAEVAAMVTAAGAALGPIDLLVNNAAAPQYIVPLADLDGVDDAVWDRMFAVNVKGMFYCARAVAPAMRARGEGAIVNIASIAGLSGDGSSLPYAVSKAAVVGLTRSLARTLAPDVRVWCVAPGLVKTRRTEGAEDSLARFAAQTLLGRTAAPHDVAALVCALLWRRTEPRAGPSSTAAASLAANSLSSVSLALIERQGYVSCPYFWSHSCFPTGLRSMYLSARFIRASRLQGRSKNMASQQRRHAAFMIVATCTIVGLTLVGAPPAAHAGRGPATASAPSAAKALITVAPRTVSRGSVILVSGAGFTANETITLTIDSVSTPAVLAKATSAGLLPSTGLPIPYSLAPGRYVVTATGATSKKSASSAINVRALAPRIATSTRTVAPGTMVRMTGRDFAAGELVTLSLNGEALVTSPTPITTTADGTFSASLRIPSTLLRGSNTLSAIGNATANSAQLVLVGTLALANRYYFAGALNTGSSHSFLTLLNDNAQPTTVRFTLYFDNGATFTHLAAVPAFEQRRISVADYSLPQGTFGLAVDSDRRVGAAVEILRDGEDGDALFGTVALRNTWYLAAGSTGGTFNETLSILNPDKTTTANVQLQLLISNGARKTVVVTAAPHTNAVIDVNSIFPGRAVGIVAISDHQVVVERTLTFGPRGAGLTTRGGTSVAATQWLFADATTENNVKTIFSVLNPGDNVAVVSLSFSRSDGAFLGSKTIVVPARGLGSLDMGSVVSGGGIAVAVASNAAVVVERSEYIGTPDSAAAGSVLVGRSGTGVRWSFPGGNTDNRDEALILYNPSGVTIPVKATFYDNAKHAQIVQQVTLTPGAHVAIAVNTVGVTSYHGAVLTSTNGQGFIAEQGISTRDSKELRSSSGIAQ